jgi:hypothetical protein
MVITSTVMADSYFSQQNPQYPQQFNDGQSNPRRTNPWLLPETSEKSRGFQQYPDYQAQQYTDNQQSQDKQHIDKQAQIFRFVTPEILESLKQQQTQSQLMPGSDYNSRQPASGRYGYSPYGMGYSDPIYDVPAVSPWGSGPDVLYRGGSNPWVPNEAIGGIPPISIPSYDQYSYQDDTNSTEKQKKYDVFNPFTLLPNGN